MLREGFTWWPAAEQTLPDIIPPPSARDAVNHSSKDLSSAVAITVLPHPARTPLTVDIQMNSQVFR